MQFYVHCSTVRTGRASSGIYPVWSQARSRTRHADKPPGLRGRYIQHHGKVRQLESRFPRPEINRQTCRLDCNFGNLLLLSVWPAFATLGCVYLHTEIFLPAGTAILDSRASLLSVCVSECVVSTACISLYLHALRKALDRIDCSLRGNKFCRQRIISAIVVGYTEAVPLPSTSTSISLPSLVHNKPTTSIRIEG